MGIHFVCNGETDVSGIIDLSIIYIKGPWILDKIESRRRPKKV